MRLIALHCDLLLELFDFNNFTEILFFVVFKNHNMVPYHFVPLWDEMNGHHLMSEDRTKATIVDIKECFNTQQLYLLAQMDILYHFQLVQIKFQSYLII